LDVNPASCVFLLLVAVVIFGCETTGGVIGGLIPAPKFLKGEIQNNTYTSKDKSFSIAVPHTQESYEYKYMQIKEQDLEYGSYVSFGPAALDQTIYRVETAKRVTPGSQNANFENAATAAVENYKSQLQKGYGTAAVEVNSGKEKINGKNALHWRLTQTVPARKLINSRAVALTHEVYAIDFEKVVVLVWVQTPETTKKNAMEPRSLAESVVIY
jgi:hypothetical protein